MIGEHKICILFRYGYGSCYKARGSYTLALMFKDYPGEIYAVRKDSPMIIGVNNGEAYLASDVPAILKYTRSVYYIGNLELARLDKGNVTFYNLDGNEIEKDMVEITWNAEEAEKSGFEHFMMKEIHEQPKAIRDTLNAVIKDGKIDFESTGMSKEDIDNISQIFIVACGSAYHAGIVAQYVIEALARIPVRVEMASEFRYREVLLPKDSLVVIISQSGETADSLVALREAKEKGINAYNAQLIVGYILAIELAYVRGKLSEDEYHQMINALMELPGHVENVISNKERMQWFASKFINTREVFFIGRGIYLMYMVLIC